jgi:hypothetical protein
MYNIGRNRGYSWIPLTFHDGVVWQLDLEAINFQGCGSKEISNES